MVERLTSKALKIIAMVSPFIVSMETQSACPCFFCFFEETREDRTLGAGSGSAQTTSSIQTAAAQQAYFVEPNRQETEPPMNETRRTPTASSAVPQLKSVGMPLGPEPAAQ